MGRAARRQWSALTVVRKRTESGGAVDKAEVTHCWPGGEGQKMTRVNNDWGWEYGSG